MSASVLRLADVGRVDRAGDGEVHALDDATFEVAFGELVAIMGPSGSGKSTLPALAGGLDTPTTGSVFVDEVALGELDAAAVARLRRDRIGYVFQEYNLVTDLTGGRERGSAPGTSRCRRAVSPP